MHLSQWPIDAFFFVRILLCLLHSEVSLAIIFFHFSLKSSAIFKLTYLGSQLVNFLCRESLISKRPLLLKRCASLSPFSTCNSPFNRFISCPVLMINLACFNLLSIVIVVLGFLRKFLKQVLFEVRIINFFYKKKRNCPGSLILVVIVIFIHILPNNWLGTQALPHEVAFFINFYCSWDLSI